MINHHGSCHVYARTALPTEELVEYVHRGAR